MSDYSPPPPLPPIGYASAYVAPVDPRPTCVRVIGVLGIVFGGIGVLGGLCSIPQYLGMQLAPNPVMDGMRKDSVLMGVTIGTMIVHVVLASLELAGGIGALRLRAWARKVLIWFAVVSLVATVVGMVVNVAVTQPRMDRVLKSALQGNAQLNTPGMKTMMAYGRYGGWAMTVVLMLWPVAILYYMGRPQVREAFREPGAPS